MERMNARGNGKDAFENEKFLSDCAAIYSAMEMPWLHRVEADGSVQEVHDRIREVIQEELGV
jgi:thymidylate kinase